MVRGLTNSFRIGLFHLLVFLNIPTLRLYLIASGCNIANQVVSLSGSLTL